MTVLWIAVGCSELRTPTVYEIPENFRGWVLVQYKESGCPPLPTVAGKLLFRVGENGTLCTNSEPEFGLATDEFFVSDRQRVAIPAGNPGEGGLIWNRTYSECSLTDGPVATFANFFVGTENELKNAPEHPTPRECDPHDAAQPPLEPTAEKRGGSAADR